MRFGACMRKAIWLRTKPAAMYESSPLGLRREEARNIMVAKDLRLLENLPKAIINGKPWDDKEHTITYEIPSKYSLVLDIPLVRLVDGKNTIISVRSLGSRSSCNAAIYGNFKEPAQPQIRDLLYASVLLHIIATKPLPFRGLDQTLLVYSDQAMQATAQYLITLGPEGPVCNGAVYHEMRPQTILLNLERLYNAVQDNDQGTMDYVYEQPAQLAAVSAGLINQKDVGWQPVAGWPCRACGFARACLPQGCKTGGD